MVCESACLLVYVTKMYLHNRRRTLEDLKKKKIKPPTATPMSTRQGGFLPLWCADSSEDFVQMSPLRNIWYCSYWISFPRRDFNMTQHLGRVWTVLKRNTLCQTSATFTPYEDSQRMFLFHRSLSARQETDIDSKGIVVWLSHPPRPVLYITTVAQEQFSVYM